MVKESSGWNHCWVMIESLPYARELGLAMILSATSVWKDSTRGTRPNFPMPLPSATCAVHFSSSSVATLARQLQPAQQR